MGREPIWIGSAPVRWASIRAHRPPGSRDRGAGGRTSVSAPLGIRRETTEGRGRQTTWIGQAPPPGGAFESHPAPATRLACAWCVTPKNHAAPSPSPRGRRPREWSKREWRERSEKRKRQHEKSGPFALTPALSRGRGGSFWRESIRGRGGTRGCRRWGVIGKEPSTGRVLAWIGSFSTPWGEKVPAGGMRGPTVRTTSRSRPTQPARRPWAERVESRKCGVESGSRSVGRTQRSALPRGWFWTLSTRWADGRGLDFRPERSPETHSGKRYS
jgi:hypothetical protein